MKISQAATGRPAEAEQQTRYLYWWLLVAIMFEYARPGSFVPGIDAIRLNSLIPLGLLATTCFAKGLRSPKEIFADPIAKWMFIYLGLVIISIFHAEVTIYTFERITQVLGYIFLFWMIARIVTTPARIRGVFLALILAHIFLLIMNPSVVLDPASRHYIQGATFLGDGNDFALSICILVPLALEVAFSARSKTLRILLFGVAGLLLLAAIGTSSRGATLGLVAVTAYLWWHSPRKGLSLFLISIIVAGVLVYASDLYFERMASISNYEEEGSAQSRILAWKSSTRMAIDNPILGVGAGQFPTQFGTNYRPPDFEGRYMTAHSMYFLILGELGIPGIVTLLVLVIGNLRANGRALVRLKKTPDDEVIGLSRMLLLLNAGMIGFAIAGAFLSVAYYPHIFVVTGLSVAARRIAALQPGGAAVARRPGNAYGGAKKRNNKSAVAKPTQGAVPPVANLPTRGYNRLR